MQNLFGQISQHLCRNSNDSEYKSFFGAYVVVAPEYLLFSIPIAWLIYRFRKADRGFWRWLLPREIYRHKSHWLDLKLFMISQFLIFMGVFGRLSLTTLLATWVALLVGQGVTTSITLSPLVLALFMWLIADFAIYWIHRIHHQTKILWPLHAVHHSAEVLTPFTAYRQHPLALVSVGVTSSAIIGIGQGILIGAADPETLVLEIAGINAFIVVANLAMANFHHSHIWISYGPVFGRLFISPAQHQIHHSISPKHYNKNFGRTLALWDWLFGTLYLVREKEALTFGLDEPGQASPDYHKLSPTLLRPLKQIAALVKNPGA